MGCGVGFERVFEGFWLKSVTVIFLEGVDFLEVVVIIKKSP